MNALEALPLEQLVSALKGRLESSFNNGRCVWPTLHSVSNCALTTETQVSSGIFFVKCTCLRLRTTQFPELGVLQALAIEEDLSKALYIARSIRNTLAPINKLPPELLAAITTFVDDPFRRTADCANLQFFCATVCRYWRNSLLAFPRIWSSVDTTNSRHMNLYLARSKEVPLHVNYGWMTRPGVFEKNIIPERHRLLSLSIPLDGAPHQYVAQSFLEPAESLRMLDMWMAHQQFPISATLMATISRFAPNITVLQLHDITTDLSSFKFPTLTKLTFHVTTPTIWNPNAAGLVRFLKHSPFLEELDLRLPECFKADASAGTVALAHLKSAAFNGHSIPKNKSIGVSVLPHLVLPNQSITLDVQTRTRAFSSDTSPFISVIQLGDAVLPRQSITAATIHIKDDPSGFFGHISICGEHNNWIGLNHVRVLNLGTGPLSRLRNWLNPLNLAPLHGIQTLTLGLFEFTSVEDQCVGVLWSFLRELNQVRVLNIYKMNVSLVARLLQPSDRILLFPLLEELRFRTCDPPELARSVAHDKCKWSAAMLKG